MKKYRLLIAGENVIDEFREAFRADAAKDMLEIADEDTTGDVAHYHVRTAEGFEAARLQLLGMAWEDSWRKDDVLLAFFEDDKLVLSEEH